MKKILLFCLFYSTIASCQNTNKEFNIILNKFIKCDLPLEFSKIEMEKQNPLTLTQSDFIDLHCFDSIRVHDTNYDYYSYVPNKWLYDNDYSYRTFCKFIVNNHILGLIFERSYYPDNIFNETTEYVLVTFTFNGKFISIIPIGGYYGDDVSFSSSISKDYLIEINIKNYSKDKNTKQTIIEKENRKYKITNKGKIERLLD